jgi:hypothetical protein
LVVVIAFGLFLRGPRPLACDDKNVADTVIDVVKERSTLPNNTRYVLDSIRKAGDTDAEGTLSCEADVLGEFNGAPYATAHLTYRIEHPADGRATVFVDGIDGLHFP